MQANDKLAEWIAAKGMKKGAVAAQIGVDRNRVTQWIKGVAVPQPVFRVALERLTDGAIKAGDWT